MRAELRTRAVAVESTHSSALQAFGSDADRLQAEPDVRRARIISFLGIDGAGKTTHARLLTEWLVRRGKSAVFIGNKSLSPLRARLDEIAREHGHADSFELLGADAARFGLSVPKWLAFFELCQQLPTLGDFVVLDRYVHCQLAHARFRRVTNEWLFEQLFNVFPKPDVAFFMTVAPEIALERMAKRKDEVPSIAYLRVLSEAYESLSDAPEIVRIDGNGSKLRVARQIREHLTSSLQLRRSERRG